MELEKLRNILKEKGISPSVHRIKILEYLAEAERHPTVEEAYQDLLKSVPTISKTTVYNVLKLFVEKGIAREIPIDERGVRYEYAREPHMHFKCKVCGKIYDIKGSEYMINTSKLEQEGYKVESINILIEGICKDCAKHNHS